MTPTFSYFKLKLLKFELKTLHLTVQTFFIFNVDTPMDEAVQTRENFLYSKSHFKIVYCTFNVREKIITLNFFEEEPLIVIGFYRRLKGHDELP